MCLFIFYLCVRICHTQTHTHIYICINTLYVSNMCKPFTINAKGPKPETCKPFCVPHVALAVWRTWSPEALPALSERESGNPNPKLYIYIYVYIWLPPPMIYHRWVWELRGSTRSAETVTSRKSPAAPLYCTICEAVSFAMSLCILRSLYVRALD